MLEAIPADPVIEGAQPTRPAALRNQVHEIIVNLLSGQDREGQSARDRLLHCLSLYPGQPERALLEHLLTRGQIGREAPEGA